MISVMVGSARKRSSGPRPSASSASSPIERVAVDVRRDARVELPDDAAERVQHLRAHRRIVELLRVDRREVEVLEEQLVDLAADLAVLVAFSLERVALRRGGDDVLLRWRCRLPVRCGDARAAVLPRAPASARHLIRPLRPIGARRRRRGRRVMPGRRDAAGSPCDVDMLLAHRRRAVSARHAGSAAAAAFCASSANR